MRIKVCDHLSSFVTAQIKTAKAYECEECVRKGDTWVHLRTCQECEVTLCCDSSPNKHASAHFHDKGHAIISSAEPREKWLWCYEDKSFLKF